MPPYFDDILDRARVELVEEIFHPECVMHRPSGTVVGIDAVRGVAERRKETFSQFETEIHDIFGSGIGWWSGFLTEDLEAACGDLV